MNTQAYKLTAISFPGYNAAVEFINANSGKWTWIKQPDGLEQAYDIFPCGNGVWSVVFAKTVTVFQEIIEGVMEKLDADRAQKAVSKAAKSLKQTRLHDLIPADKYNDSGSYVMLSDGNPVYKQGRT